MVHKIDKFLRSLTKKEFAKIKPIIVDLENGNIERYQYKKLKNRIIFRITKEKEVILVSVVQRSDNTYK